MSEGELTERGDVTELLMRWAAGDEDALRHLMPLVHAECMRIAARHMRHERSEHTLSPTALVNELYLRLVDQKRAQWAHRAQFFATAARLMRRILVDHARANETQKRGGSRIRLSLDAAQDAPIHDGVADAIAVDDALRRLAALDSAQEEIVELRFFAGLTVDEIARIQNRSPRTVKREWQLARAWLFRELYPERVSSEPELR